jgi:hypothetical protein
MLTGLPYCFKDDKKPRRRGKHHLGALGPPTRQDQSDRGDLDLAGAAPIAAVLPNLPDPLRQQ